MKKVRNSAYLQGIYNLLCSSGEDMISFITIGHLQDNSSPPFLSTRVGRISKLSLKIPVLWLVIRSNTNLGTAVKRFCKCN